MTGLEKPYAPACERNQNVILQVFQKHLRATDKYVFEVGSGTGQHAVFIAKEMPHLVWQTSDVMANHVGINMWVDDAQLFGVLPPVEYTIGQSEWPDVPLDMVYTANTLHIISFDLVQRFIKDLGNYLRTGNRVFFYGPFKYAGDFTSASNADFDLWLKDIDPLRGIRDIEAIQQLMRLQGFHLLQDISMPANNQMLIFEKL